MVYGVNFGKKKAFGGTKSRLIGGPDPKPTERYSDQHIAALGIISREKA